MSGKKDFTELAPEELIACAITYKKQLSDYFSKKVSPHHIQADFVLYTGDIITYDGPYDFTQPALRRAVKEGTLPRAKDLMDAAREKKCEPRLRLIFGAYLTYAITHQTTDPVIEYVGNRPVNQSVSISDQRLWLYCEPKHS